MRESGSDVKMERDSKIRCGQGEDSVERKAWPATMTGEDSECWRFFKFRCSFTKPRFGLVARALQILASFHPFHFG